MFNLRAIIVLIIILAGFLPLSAQDQQDVKGVAVVTDVQGKCWLHRRGMDKPSLVAKTNILLPLDTLKTEKGAKVRILLWNGDIKKSIFEESVYIIPQAVKTGKEEKGFLDFAFGLVKEKYDELSNFIVQSEEKEGAIKNLTIPSTPFKSEFSPYSLLYPRNEYLLGNNIEFKWMPMGNEQKYRLMIKEDDTQIWSRETTENALNVSYPFKVDRKYSWAVEFIDSETSNNETADFWLLSPESILELNKEIDELVQAEELTLRQELMMKGFIYDKHNLHSMAVQEYIKTLRQPNAEQWEIHGFIKMSYEKMKFPDSPESFNFFLGMIKRR